jgi:hypothetical protein
MKLILLALGLVFVDLDARTKVDRRTGRLNTTPMLRAVLKRYGYPVEHADNGLLYVKGLACGEEACGATWSDRGNHPAMRYDSRSANYPNGSPEYVYCTVCDLGRKTASGVFEQLCAKGRAKALDAWSITRLPVIDFTAIRCAGKTALGGSFRATAELIAPKRFDPDRDFEATLIRACSLSVANEALKSADFPAEAWVTVPVQHTLWPKAAWHSQPMTMTDSAPIRAYEKYQRREAEAAVAAEVEQFRADLEARA